MPKLDLTGGAIFNYGSSGGLGPIYQNPDPKQGGVQSFGGLWMVILILAAIGILIFFVMR